MINYCSLLSVALFAILSQEAPKALSEFTERERTSALQLTLRHTPPRTNRTDHVVKVTQATACTLEEIK
ncbi:hypothetical protein NQZ68_033251 [Dissostichus eleginoides]|nr:hypothetical protein NQZ68_033251 [Dissostichus eleginoides]